MDSLYLINEKVYEITNSKIIKDVYSGKNITVIIVHDKEINSNAFYISNVVHFILNFRQNAHKFLTGLNCKSVTNISCIYIVWQYFCIEIEATQPIEPAGLTANAVNG